MRCVDHVRDIGRRSIAVMKISNSQVEEEAEKEEEEFSVSEA